ncbi:MAG: hydrogenase formation protein HypD [Alphaproteobacteria bacterium]
MKNINTDFKNKEYVQKLIHQIECEIDDRQAYRIMEFCGGHTHSICSYALDDILPSNIKLIHGPGCPVCVLPAGRLKMAIDLAKQEDIVLCSYGDMMRVPAAKQSLLSTKAQGADIRMVYSPLQCMEIARDNPNKQIVFLAIGFETTTPATAVLLQKSNEANLDNISVFCNHVTTPAALDVILKRKNLPIDALIGPGHVSLITGLGIFEQAIKMNPKPICISGFEPVDLLSSIYALVQQINRKEAYVENKYERAVIKEGNLKAQALMAKFFELRPQFAWRGLGSIKNSGLAIAPKYEKFDAEKRFMMEEIELKDPKACQCSDIILGLAEPFECKVFGNKCTPENPIGSCMVSGEGACAAYYQYKKMDYSVS